jgi:hypothetical protein
MRIRKARTFDVNRIKSLADALAVGPNDSNKISGFYNYSLNGQQYLNRIFSYFSYVAESKEELEGFCMAYDTDFLQDLIKREDKLKDDSISKYLVELNTPLVYIDQLAVREPGTTIGSLAAYYLRENLTDDAKKSGIPSILCAVSHKPWKNILSIRFCKKSNFEFQQEINSNGTTLGIYKLNL